MKHFIALALLVTFTYSCVHGPGQKKKSSLNVLNGEHYQADSKIGVIPLSIKRKTKNTEIFGNVIENSFNTSLKFVTVILLKNNKEIVRVSSDQNGNFLFLGNFDDGNYLLKIESDRYEAQKEIVVSGYKHEGATLAAKAK